jgi:hypothetical protein
MTRNEELKVVLDRVEDTIRGLTQVVEQLGLLNVTLRRLFAQEMVTKPDFDYKTGMPPKV